MKSNPVQFAYRLKNRLARTLLGFTARQGGQCGTRNASTRDVWLQKALASITPGSRILDAGAGELQYKRFCAHLNYVSQDFAQYNGLGNSIGLQTGNWDQSRLDIVSDITQIPEADASFDAVMCIEVLEHVPYPVDALRELCRLLKPGGTLIVTAPFNSLTHFAPYFYQTGYSRYFYEYWLPKFGCEIEDMQWNGNYFEYLAQELRRLPSMGREYADIGPTHVQQQAINLILGLLNQLAQHNNGSEQLLAFGLHIRACKRSQ